MSEKRTIAASSISFRLLHLLCEYANIQPLRLINAVYLRPLWVRDNGEFLCISESLGLGLVELGLVDDIPPPQFSAHVYCGQTVAHLSYCSEVTTLWRYRNECIIMVALCNRADHYIFALWFLSSSSFFLSSPNLSGRRLGVYHTSTHGVALSVNLRCRSETCCTRIAGKTKKSPKIAKFVGLYLCN